MAERSTLGLAHQLLDLLRENQEQTVSLEHARLLVNLARALVRPQDAQEDNFGAEIALDLPGAAADAPSAHVKTAEPERRSDIVDAAVTSAVLVKTPEPRKDHYEKDTLGVAAPAHSSLEHLDASTRSTYQPSAIVKTEHADPSASSNTTLSTNRTLEESSAQDTSLDAPFLPPVVVATTTSALVQPPKCAVSAELVVPALYFGHQHVPAAPGAATSTTVSPRSRDDAAHTKTELTESAALPPAIPFTELSPLVKEEDAPILLLAKYPPPLPLHTYERASASPPARVKTEPVDSPGLSSLPIGPGDETNASAPPVPNSTYTPLSEVYQTHMKIEPVDPPALFSLPSPIASVRRSLVSTAEEGDSSIPPSVPLENATAPRVLVKTELIEEDALAAPSMHVPSTQRNGGLHWPSSTASCVIYHHSHTPTFQHEPAKAEPVDAFISAVQPSPKDVAGTPIAHSAEHLPASTPASPSVKAEPDDVDLAHEQEPLSSLAPTTGALSLLVKAEPVDPFIPSTDETDTPILRLAKYPHAPTPTPVNDGDVQSLRTTHMPSELKEDDASLPSLVTAASSNAARDYDTTVPRQSPTTGDSVPEQTVLEIASAPAAVVENAAYIPILQHSPTTLGDSLPGQTVLEIPSASAPSNAMAAFENTAYTPILHHLPTTPGDYLPGQTVLEILSTPATLSPSSGATSAIHVGDPLPRVVHVESEFMATSAPSTHDERKASTAPSSSSDSNADAGDVVPDRISTRSPSPSACSIAPPDAAPPSHASNSAATSAAEYANVFMLAAWSDDETSPVNAQQQELFPPVPPPTPASSSHMSVSPSPNPAVPRSPSPSPGSAPVVPLQTDFPTAAEASYDAAAPMDVDGGSLPRAHEGAGAETEEQEEEHHIPRLLLRMSSPVVASMQGQRDDTTKADGPARELPDDDVQHLGADGRAGQEGEDAAPHVLSLLRRMSGSLHDHNLGATEQQDEEDSLPSTSNIFSRLGGVQTVSGPASLRSRFDSPPPPPLSLAERISPPSSVRAEHHGHSSFKRRFRGDGMEDGESAVGRSGSKRRRRK